MNMISLNKAPAFVCCAALIALFFAANLSIGQEPSHNAVSQYALIVDAVSSPAQTPDMRRAKKLIATGWDWMDNSRLAENLAEMEQRPFDGAVMKVNGYNDEGEQVLLRWAFLNEKWKRKWFQKAVDQLKAANFRRLTDNFISLNANPGNVDWFDDEGWANIVEHWRIAAWVARQSGFKGILFDPEPYTRPHAQFKYIAQPQRDRYTFDEYYAKARQRGREVMQAITDEYPDITLFCYFMNSVNAKATGYANPRLALSTLGYGLYPAFIDGWLDVVPPTVTMVDGCESAYQYNSVQQYLKAGVLIKGACQELVSPENRAKYRAQVQVSFGVYLDAYWNPADSPWYIDGLGRPRVERLRANVATALRVADEYVWIYGEKFRWWPTPKPGVNQQTWPEALPGCEQVLRYVRDPVGYARKEIERLKESGEFVNLARNADFGSEQVTLDGGKTSAYREGAPPAGWGAWQASTSKGAFTWDRERGATADGCARATGVTFGCFIQSCSVQPGERYAVRALRRLEGNGIALIRVRWQTAEGQWTQRTRDQLIFCPGPRAEWAELFGVVGVPYGVGRLIILLGIRDQRSQADVVWYDDIELCKLQ